MGQVLQVDSREVLSFQIGTASLCSLMGWKVISYQNGDLKKSASWPITHLAWAAKVLSPGQWDHPQSLTGPT